MVFYKIEAQRKSGDKKALRGEHQGQVVHSSVFAEDIGQPKEIQKGRPLKTGFSV